jgi:hypothetical protein
VDDEPNQELAGADRPGADDVAGRVEAILTAADAAASAIIAEATRAAAAIRGAASRDAGDLAARIRAQVDAAELEIGRAGRRCDALAAELRRFSEDTLAAEAGPARIAPGGAAGAPSADPVPGEAAGAGPVTPGPAPLPPPAPPVPVPGRAPLPPPAPSPAPVPGPVGSTPETDAAVPDRPPRSAETDLQRTARLIALPMAVAGRSREEVERHLRQSLGLSDPTPVLDRVFGDPADLGGSRAKRQAGR